MTTLDIHLECTTARLVPTNEDPRLNDPVSADIEALAGRTLYVGFEGAEVPRVLVDAILERRVGGVVLFSRNFTSPQSCRDLCAQLRTHDPDLWIAIDQEGGRVQRLKSPFPELPAMRVFGRQGRKSLCRQAGGLLGRALRGLGIDQTFAPVMDVDSNPDNPVIGDRSFGSDPARVARLGSAFIDGLQSEGVAGCAKHFPGHGDTNVDSHLALPWVTADLDQLRQRELVPFRAAARTQVASIMSAHVVVPAFDPEGPATLSRRILQDLLRQEIGYDGVLVSDDLEMKGIQAPIPEAAVGAVAAGCDVLLVCSRLDEAEGARRALVDAVASGALPASTLVDAARRRCRLRSSFPRHPDTTVDWQDLGEERAALLAELSNPTPRSVVEEDESEFAFQGDPTLVLELDEV